MQRKRSNEKIAIRKISFSTHKMLFSFFFLLFGPLLISKLLTFSFFFHFKWFKVLKGCHLQFYKSSLNSNSNRATYKKFFGVFRNQLCNIQRFVLWLTLGAITFSILIHFCQFWVCQMHNRRSSSSSFVGHQKQQSPPFRYTACPEHLNVCSPTILP